jgi:hypothetical protein
MQHLRADSLFIEEFDGLFICGSSEAYHIIRP